MREILFLSHRIPFPPDRGDKIRSHHMLKALAKLAPVHVGTFADDADDMAHEGELASITASHCLIERRKSLPRAGVEALATRAPISLTAFRDARLSAYVAQVLRERPVDAIYVFSGQMGQYVPRDFAGRILADLVDVDSAKFEAYAAAGHGFRAWMESREARLLAREEARIAAQADQAVLISEAEAALFRARLPKGTAAQVRAIGNGIDSDLFAPTVVAPEPLIVGSGGPRLIFTGQMDYAPNIAAALRAMDRVLPLVRRQCPDATLHIVGRNPSAALLARHGTDGVHVWGRVPDIRPWLAGADLALVPLDIARGVQNKVLEAMAMALPVVLTSGAATGIDAMPGREFLIADADNQLAEAIVALTRDPDRARAISDAARAWIVANASWEAALAPLGDCLGLSREWPDAA